MRKGVESSAHASMGRAGLRLDCCLHNGLQLAARTRAFCSLPTTGAEVCAQWFSVCRLSAVRFRAVFHPRRIRSLGEACISGIWLDDLSRPKVDGPVAHCLSPNSARTLSDTLHLLLPTVRSAWYRKALPGTTARCAQSDYDVFKRGP